MGLHTQPSQKSIGNEYAVATEIFKLLRKCNWIHGSISRPKSIKAIHRLLVGDHIEAGIPPGPEFPIIDRLLLPNSSNPQYTERTLGVLKYLRGDYLKERT